MAEGTELEEVIKFIKNFQLISRAKLNNKDRNTTLSIIYYYLGEKVGIGQIDGRVLV